ncbi:MAG: hypothetical protein KDA84_05915 [Planctomycetaceae bacterium]|nr:hypothetical protein [Planctomycetaceae bacterium]
MISSLCRLVFLTTLIVLQPLSVNADHRSGFNSYGTYGANAWNTSGIPPQFNNHTYGSPGYPNLGYQRRGPIVGGGQDVQAAIQQLYITYLGRRAEPAGMKSWLDHIRFRGGNLQEVKLGIMSADECFSRFNRRPQGYVQYLFLQETGRYPSDHELRFWLSRFHAYRGNLNLFCRDLVSNVW